MSSLAIPAAPPSAASASPAATVGNVAGGAAPTTGDGKFGDTLRQTQARPETQAQGRVADDGPTLQPTGGKPDAGSKDDAKDDSHAGNQANATVDDRTADTANALPIVAPLMPPAPATARQAPAAGGKPLPVATAPAALTCTATAVAAALGGAVSSARAHPAVAANATRADPQVETQVEAQTETTSDANSASTAPRTPTHDADTQADAKGDSVAGTPHAAPIDFTAQLGQLMGAHTAPVANSAPPLAPAQLTMHATPDQQPQFMQEAAQSVAWLAGQGIQKAQIQLNPRALGPIHVEISTHDARVDVSFAVAHPQTVHALQQTLPHLNDMLAQQGLNLGQASVGQQSSGQQHAAFAQHLGGSASGNANSAEAEAPQNWRPLRLATPGRVDDFA